MYKRLTLSQAQIGDKDPINYGGGYVYFDKDTDTYVVEYCYGLEVVEGPVTSNTPLDLYSVPFSKNDNLINTFSWADWDAVAAFISTDITRYKRTYNPRSLRCQLRALTDLAGYYGWYELDSYPRIMTLEDLAKHWKTPLERYVDAEDEYEDEDGG